VLGETEITYLKSMDPTLRRENLKKFFSFPIPCVFITKGQEPGPDLLEIAASAGVALIRSHLKTDEFYNRLKPWLEEEFSPRSPHHAAALPDVFCLVGKAHRQSECVLDLVERGHRFVADDLVIGAPARPQRRRWHELQKHHMEIRGVGHRHSVVSAWRGAPSETHRGYSSSTGITATRRTHRLDTETTTIPR
jgi:HPr kinase/phosphorylase